MLNRWRKSLRYARIYILLDSSCQRFNYELLITIVVIIRLGKCLCRQFLAAQREGLAHLTAMVQKAARDVRIMDQALAEKPISARMEY